MNSHIESCAATYAEARRALSSAVENLNTEIESLKRRALPRIRRLVNGAAEQKAMLSAAIQINAADFASPRTVVLHGIKLGFRKGNGGIEWDDDETVVKLIRKHFPDDSADLLIKTTEKPIAKALAELDVATLKKIGCRVEATGDVVVIKPADSEVDKIVNALLKGATEDEAK